MSEDSCDVAIIGRGRASGGRRHYVQAVAEVSQIAKAVGKGYVAGIEAVGYAKKIGDS